MIHHSARLEVRMPETNKVVKIVEADSDGCPMVVRGYASDACRHPDAENTDGLCLAPSRCPLRETPVLIVAKEEP